LEDPSSVLDNTGRDKLTNPRLELRFEKRIGKPRKGSSLIELRWFVPYKPYYFQFKADQIYKLEDSKSVKLFSSPEQHALGWQNLCF
jgi:hypothetical protein